MPLSSLPSHYIEFWLCERLRERKREMHKAVFQQISCTHAHGVSLCIFQHEYGVWSFAARLHFTAFVPKWTRLTHNTMRWWSLRMYTHRNSCIAIQYSPLNKIEPERRVCVLLSVYVFDALKFQLVAICCSSFLCLYFGFCVHKAHAFQNCVWFVCLILHNIALKHSILWCISICCYIVRAQWFFPISPFPFLFSFLFFNFSHFCIFLYCGWYTSFTCAV